MSQGLDDRYGSDLGVFLKFMKVKGRLSYQIGFLKVLRF